MRLRCLYILQLLTIGNRLHPFVLEVTVIDGKVLQNSVGLQQTGQTLHTDSSKLGREAKSEKRGEYIERPSLMSL